jgi:hypothetical protein
MRYRFITKTEEDPFERNVVEIAAEEACRKLGIPKPRIRFFRRWPGEGFLFDEHFTASDPYLTGEYVRGEGIRIRADLGPVEMALATIHECRHHWQFGLADWRDRSSDERERDAFAFEREWPRGE